MKFILKYPWLVVAAVALVTVIFALQLPGAILDNDVANFVPKANPDRTAYAKMEDEFGAQMIMLIGLRNTYGTVFEKGFIQNIMSLTDRIKEIPYVDSVSSLTSTEYIRGEGDRILVSPLVDASFQGTEAEITELKKKVLSWELYHRSLVSDDFKSTQILVTIESIGAQQNKGRPIDPKKVVYTEIQGVLAGMGLKDVEVYQSGLPTISVLLSKNMQKDLVVLIPLVILIIVFSLYFSFKRLGGIILPLGTVLISVIWAMGLMCMLGFKLSMIATVIPVILMAVGSAYGIHVISHYYDELLEFKGDIDGERHKALIIEALKKTGVPVFLAGITTIAGFGSLAFTSILPIRDFGIFSSFGVLVALACSLTLIPALLVIRGPYRLKKNQGMHTGQDLTSKLLLKFFLPFIDHPRTVLLFSLVLIALSIWGGTRIVVDNAIAEYFRPDTDIARSDKFLREEFNGTKTFSIAVRGREKGDLNNPRILSAMDDLSGYLETTYPQVGKVISYSQFIKRINQVINADEPASGFAPSGLAPPSEAPAKTDETPAFGFDSFVPEKTPPIASSSLKGKRADGGDIPLNAKEFARILNEAYARTGKRVTSSDELISLINRDTNYEGSAYYEIPRDPQRYGLSGPEDLPNLIANYLVLVGSGTAEWSDDPLEPMTARIAVQLNTTGNIATAKIVKSIKAFAASRFPDGYTVEIAGPALIEMSVANLISRSQFINIACSILMVFLILTVYFKSLIAGAISLVPLVFSITLNFGIMGWLEIKLDTATSMVAAIAIGTGIDYTIHFLSAFHRLRKSHEDHRMIMNKTILTTGKAIMFNAISVAAGLVVLAGSQFKPLVYLGALIAVIMMTSSLAALTIMPIILDLLKPKFITKPLFFEKAEGGQA